MGEKQESGSSRWIRKISDYREKTGGDRQRLMQKDQGGGWETMVV